VDSILVRVKTGAAQGGISFKADMPWGPSVAFISVPASETGGEWLVLSSAAEEVQGIHALWLVFDGNEKELFTVDWLEFK
jgi:hypothetical protein